MTYIFGDLGRCWSIFLGFGEQRQNTFREPRYTGNSLKLMQIRNKDLVFLLSCKCWVRALSEKIVLEFFTAFKNTKNWS